MCTCTCQWLCRLCGGIATRRVYAVLEQFGRGAVLLTAARHERRRRSAAAGDSDSGRVGIGGCERRCVLEIGEDGLPVTVPVASEPSPNPTPQAGERKGRAASASGVDADMDVLDFEICGGGVMSFFFFFSLYPLVLHGEKRDKCYTYCGGRRHVRGGAKVYVRAVVLGDGHRAP